MNSITSSKLAAWVISVRRRIDSAYAEGVRLDEQRLREELECPICGRPKTVCDGDCFCPECRGFGAEMGYGEILDCSACGGYGVIIPPGDKPEGGV